MTIEAETYVNRYAGNGSTKVFAYDFKIDDDDHIDVIIADADGAETTLTKITHYTVSGEGDKDGGNVTTEDLTAICGAADLPANWNLVIVRDVPLLQETDLANQGPFNAETHETAFDYLTAICQQMQEQLDRCPKTDIVEGTAGSTYLTTIEGHVTDAETAKTAAELAETNAETAETNAETAETNAETAETNAAASAAGLNLPAIEAGDGEKGLQVKEDESGYEHVALVTGLPSGKIIDLIYNVGFTAVENVPATKSLTVTLTDAIGAALSANNVARAYFRHATLTTGQGVSVNVSANISLVLPIGATLGFVNDVVGTVYVYLINNAGTLELAVSKKFFDNSPLVTTVLLNADADSEDVIYSTTVRTNVACICIGHFVVVNAITGWWNVAPTELYAGVVPRLQIKKQTDIINFTDATGGGVAVTNASTSIVTKGGPVLIVIQPDGATGAEVSVDDDDVAGVYGFFKVVRDATTYVAHWTFGILANVTPALDDLKLKIPGNLVCIDTPPAGEHTYTLKVSSVIAGCTISVKRIDLIAVELGR